MLLIWRLWLENEKADLHTADRLVFPNAVEKGYSNL
jgi:hypothetical protein